MTESTIDDVAEAMREVDPELGISVVELRRRSTESA